MIQEAITQYLQKQRQVSFSPKAVLFDMDGVLYDSMRFHARAWYETATHHQLISTPELFYLYEGRTGESTINELYQKTFLRDATDEEKKSIYEEKAILFNQYNDGKAMQGAAEVLKKSKSLRLANTCRNRFRTTQLNQQAGTYLPRLFQTGKDGDGL